MNGFSSKLCACLRQWKWLTIETIWPPISSINYTLHNGNVLKYRSSLSSTWYFCVICVYWMCVHVCMNVCYIHKCVTTYVFKMSLAQILLITGVLVFPAHTNMCVQAWTHACNTCTAWMHALKLGFPVTSHITVLHWHRDRTIRTHTTTEREKESLCEIKYGIT